MEAIFLECGAGRPQLKRNPLCGRPTSHENPLSNPRLSFRYAIGLLAASLPSHLASQAAVDTAGAIRAADSAAHAWLRLIDKGHLTESWNQAALSFQAEVSADEWPQVVNTTRGPFRPFRLRSRVAARYTTVIPTMPPGQYVILHYRTRVSGGHTVIENVTLGLDGERGWRVSGYVVRPEP